MFATFFVLASFSITLIERDNVVESLSGKTAEITALITEEPEDHGEINFISAETESINISDAPQKIHITFASYNKEIKEFDRVKLAVRFSEVPDEYKRDYFSRKNYLSVSLLRVISIEESNDLHPYKYAIDLRKAVRNSITENLSDETEGILAGFIIGGSRLLDDYTYSAFKTCGINHMIAVSGMHMSVLCSALTSLFSYLKLRRRNRIFIILPIILIYCALSGFTPSAIRAVIMVSAVFLTDFTKKRVDRLNMLGATAIAMLIISPNLICSISFALSFLALLGILVFNPILTKYTTAKITIPNALGFSARYIVDTAITSFSAIVGIFPISVFVLGGMSNISVIANLLISFICTVSIIFGMVCVITDLILGGFISALFYSVCELFLYYIRGTAITLAEIPFSYTVFDSYSTILTSLIGILVIIYMIVRGNQFPKRCIQYLTTAAVTVLFISIFVNLLNL